jgi:signal transduction histidine kinase/ligand-binding sensor domain-containing protein
MLTRNNKLRTFRLLSASTVFLVVCLSVAAQDSDRANHQNIPSAPPGSYSRSCIDIEMRHGTLRATCQSIDGHWIKTELSDPSRCPGRITNQNGHLACGDSSAPSAAPQRVASTSVQGWDRTIAQFQHTAWDAKEGAPGHIRALAQTADGYLWLGTPSGLYRFDGISFERYEPHSGGPFPGRVVSSLLPLPNGDLWIGFSFGRISLLRDGRATNYATREGIPQSQVRTLARDREGTIWVASAGGLLRLERNQWKIVGEDWNFPGKSAQTAFVDRQGTLWVATEDSIVFLPAGSKMFQPTGIQVGSVSRITEARNGKLWMAETTRSVRPIPLGDKLLPSDDTEIKVGSAGILFDQEGALWVTSVGDGLRRAAQPTGLSGELGEFSDAVEGFTAKDGLTDDFGWSTIEDREGNIWVGTQGGLDRFRRSSLVPVALPVPLREPRLAPGDAGDLLVSARNLWVRVHGSRADSIRGLTLGTDTNAIQAAYRDPVGTVWWAGLVAFYRLENGRMTQFRLPAELATENLSAMPFTEDRSGVLWVGTTGEGLFRMKDGVWISYQTSPELARLTVRAAYTDWMGHVWFGYDGGTIVAIENGSLHTISTGDESPVGSVYVIGGRGQHLWVGGERGLVFFDGSRFRKVVPVDASTFDPVWGIEETSDGSLWLGERRGVVHIGGDEVAKYVSNPSFQVRYELFDSLDGLPGAFEDPLNSEEVQGTDGRLWFAASNGLAWLDPAHISRNALAPPVSIQSLTADDKLYPYWASPALPALTGHLEIKFTALSLSIPERNHFRYKLEGYDKDWREIGTQRQASYTNLSPRKYRFRVIASNNDGVWNEAGATLDFSVLPAWYQTIWFRSLCVAAFGLFLWGLYQVRLHQLAQQFNMTLEARVDERTRVARELHDTLLQSFQGLLLRFQTASELFPTRPAEAKQTIDSAIEQAAQAITEGRDAVQGLRSSTTVVNDLACAITTLGTELAGSESNPNAADFHVNVEGTPRDLHPILRDQVYRIAGEALRNALRHAEARRIEVEIRYDEREFRLRVRDDGKGIDSKLLNENVRPGHYGMRGMRERAKLLGGKLTVWSEVETGTEVDLSIPAANAYVTPDGSGRSWLAEKFAGKMVEQGTERKL